MITTKNICQSQQSNWRLFNRNFSNCNIFVLTQTCEYHLLNVDFCFFQTKKVILSATTVFWTSSSVQLHCFDETSVLLQCLERKSQCSYSILNAKLSAATLFWTETSVQLQCFERISQCSYNVLNVTLIAATVFWT